MADTDSKWLRKATWLERMFEIGHQMQVYLTQYTLHLSSAKPIDEDLLRKALIHLYRQVPVLRVCLRERNSQLWLREMERCHIDLKVIEGGDLEQEKDKVTLHTYSSEEGPLWCIRFLPLAREISSTPSSQRDRDYSYDYTLIFGIRHSIADGTTNVKICNLLCNILNDLMVGRTINDEQQLGELHGEEKTLSLYDQEMVRLKRDPKLCKEIKRELEDESKVRPLIRHACKIPSDVTVMTRNVEVAFDKAISERFYKKAKSKGVHLHSALAGLINLALTKLLQELGVVQEEYNIRAGHDINIRRYFAGDSSRILGVQGSRCIYSAPYCTPKDMLPVFWETVLEFQKKFHSDLSNRKVLTTSAYRIMTEGTNENFKEMFRADDEPNSYYTISNMGNLKGRLTEGGESVIVRKLTRFCSIRNDGSFLCIFIHTFRGQLNINFAYSTRFLTHDFVHKLKELFHTHMVSVCEM